MAILSILAVILCVACDRQKNDVQGKSNVCVSTYPIWLFTRSIMAGSGAEPLLIIPADAGCPHDYSLTPQDLRKLPQSGTLFLNGGGLDAQIADTILTVAPKLQQCDVSAGIEPIAAADDDDDDHDHEEHNASGEEEHHHHHGDKNGHFFSSPLAVVQIVNNISSTLAVLDQEHADLYRANAAALTAKLTALANDFKSVLAPAKDVETATQHDVFAYLFRDIGMKEPHVIFSDPEVPLSPAELTETARRFKADGVKVIFTEPQYPEKMAQLLSTETGIPVVKLDPVASGPENPPADYYEQQMRNNLELMRKAMVR